MVGKLERVPLREVWEHEAADFTRWLEENIDVLGEALDLNLSSAEREQSAGAFSVDLVAADEGGDAVVIECQLEKSNHDHLGKLVTYLSAVGAKTAIWIVADPRPEHVGAVSWLNESSAADVHIVKVEAVRIGASDPAPLLTHIVGPSDATREARKRKRELSGRQAVYYAFWKQLADSATARPEHPFKVAPRRGMYTGTSAGITGVDLNHVILKDRARVHLYIHNGGQGGRARNEGIFESLAASKQKIEADFGDELDWVTPETRGGGDAYGVQYWIDDIGGLSDEEKWPEIQDAMIDAMIRLEKALRPHIDRLRV
jgi:hypothetical protein